MKNKSVKIVIDGQETSAVTKASLKDAYESLSTQLSFKDYHSFRGRIHYLLKQNKIDKYNVINLVTKTEGKLVLEALSQEEETVAIQ
jgi:hypothetical protein